MYLYEPRLVNSLVSLILFSPDLCVSQKLKIIIRTGCLLPVFIDFPKKKSIEEINISRHVMSNDVDFFVFKSLDLKIQFAHIESNPCKKRHKSVIIILWTIGVIREDYKATLIDNFREMISQVWINLVIKLKGFRRVAIGVGLGTP
ncbi:hypothetical protein BpHYR1_030170 [Brachionus plicatilis]|uniref:Uncharacterized protein n=1 Tax=Brachionus plicatilis TaxID=10195 RepID=A0A3M7RH19_BRAPC|nr:hypothetical protein BpHYR1_030170 [Brachionus plicatilis]